ncbi:MAG: hypothetical protein COZ91_00975 [Candidatus Nealsonbacteria bacterium CG_4_8_14_3_um_filter_39_7]|uniref:Uncharacterized protein n=1 Tax=Candidatus Nealsonbacteria bacterium CG23_combo_of_CG06-09_8_20_14_all_39_17 TaxID=1974722 RepID=A0A2G9YV92_9BACT|nr:MAG: hypothetical protein COX37_00320 [Candidatus Nealsonbacteria bacterium CG23_combo_of_CG06-09_8_20_14_all_39_17]PIU43987.1 MAG: hypothetical protein COS96_01430 [Candidatus Nealsonbacteria bacterium CG07_land_8_20_14_0_80_39_13]PIW91505.1 MAG: hypothetical protein COZ91_00975 [Candidatus Nealsonbacteria bacterium CG_4_8_14_3_um_filter_39_7]
MSPCLITALFSIIAIFTPFPWLIRTAKAGLFWIYLWQLKEYHLGRFLAHFQTEKGQKIFFNKLFLIKILLAVGIFFLVFSGIFRQQSSPLFPFFKSFYQITGVIVFLIYIVEAYKSVLDFLKKQYKKPVLTKKMSFLILTAGITYLSLLLLVFSQPFLAKLDSFSLFPFPIFLAIPFILLLLDILTPLIISLIVLLFQPLTVLGRTLIINKAKKKIAGFKNLIVIGITGSYGKTSVKEILFAILSEKFKTARTAEHRNSEIGIAQTILEDLKPKHQIFICEMGAYCRGGIKMLCDIVKPKIGILTGINEQHMATFGSQENIIKAKFELMEALPADGIAFLNGNNRYCKNLYEKIKIKKFLYGENVGQRGMENIEGAKIVAKELGMTEEEISKSCQKIKNNLSGIEIKKGANNLIILDSTYSANPDGVFADLEYLQTYQGKRVIIMPCLIELGRSAEGVHQRIGKKIAEVCDLAIITTREFFDILKKSAIENGIKEENILFMENPTEIIKKIKDFTSPGDTVLLESRVPEQVIKSLSS